MSIEPIVLSKPVPLSCFTEFRGETSEVILPKKFTFPFYYEPHPIALLACEELQDRIQNEIVWAYNFGLGPQAKEQDIGKMFGVLVVKNKENKLGYLSAYSGKINGENLESIFVPFVYDRAGHQDAFTVEAEKLHDISKAIAELKADPQLAETKRIFEEKQHDYNHKLAKEREALREESKKRQQLRQELKGSLSEEDYKKLHQKHAQESINDKFKYKAYDEYLSNKLALVRSDYELLYTKVTDLKNIRKQKATKLQDQWNAQYNFLNSKGEYKNVIELFKDRRPKVPPSGTGDCAAPKLLQYAYLQGYKPIALAEFWWGKEPNSKVRKHKYYYPACKGKCGPLLVHMLEGLDVDPNPLLTNPALGKELETMYEDDHLVVIMKPAEFLSVPGKFITDSVQERMLKKYPAATGPMIVHRLDMSTSGLMVVAKSKEVHKSLQGQFLRRRVTKRYVALLDGLLDTNEGYIDLPLKVDHDNRPFQIVCHENGKHCRTKWEVIERNKNTTKVNFYPLSGRTHQLRVHAAHKDGLGTPIVGDDLYGKKKDRLYLHAESIAFEHPITGEQIEVVRPAEF